MKKYYFKPSRIFGTLFLLMYLGSVQTLEAQEKITITRADELPRRSYPLTGAVRDIYKNDNQIIKMAEYAHEVALADLEKYDIQDKATLSAYYSLLMLVEFRLGKYGDVLRRLEDLKNLEDKEEERATTGLTMSAAIRAIQATGTASGDDFKAAFKQEYTKNLAGVKPEFIRKYAEQTRMGLTLLDPEKSLTGLATQLQPFIDNGKGEVPESIASSIMAARIGMDFRLTTKEPILEVLEKWLAENPEKKEEGGKNDFWADRNAGLSKGGAEVVVAVWDTGVDPAPFGDQMWVNTRETPGNQKDDDQNGYIDDVNGIAFDLDNKRTSGPLLEQRNLTYSIQDLQLWSKGVMDLQAGIQSAEGKAFQEKYMTLQSGETVSFQEDLAWYGTYAHGTHVAGIVAAGNPSVKILFSRLTYDTKVTPRPFTDETQANMARMFRDAVAYFKQNGVRVVNMSWRYNAAAYEAILNLYGTGKDEQERKAIARKWFEAERDALTEAFRMAPEILFICGSGNENNDANFAEYIPAGIDLPNLITVGAVDDKGKRTAFTSEGKSVDFYANGFEIESFVPGGDRMKFSGTSMASPQVANLAARMLSIDPGLSPVEIIDIIRSTSTPDQETKGFRLIHPKNAIQMVMGNQESGNR